MTTMRRLAVFGLIVLPTLGVAGFAASFRFLAPGSQSAGIILSALLCAAPFVAFWRVRCPRCHRKLLLEAATRPVGGLAWFFELDTCPHCGQP
jgi:hypothetical protein